MTEDERLACAEPLAILPLLYTPQREAEDGAAMEAAGSEAPVVKKTAAGVAYTRRIGTREEPWQGTPRSTSAQRSSSSC